MEYGLVVLWLAMYLVVGLAALPLAAALFTARHRAKQLQDSRLHGAIAATRSESVPLVDRERADDRGR